MKHLPTTLIGLISQWEKAQYIVPHCDYTVQKHGIFKTLCCTRPQLFFLALIGSRPNIELKHHFTNNSVINLMQTNMKYSNQWIINAAEQVGIFEYEVKTTLQMNIMINIDMVP